MEQLRYSTASGSGAAAHIGSSAQTCAAGSSMSHVDSRPAAARGELQTARQDHMEHQQRPPQLHASGMPSSSSRNGSSSSSNGSMQLRFPGLVLAVLLCLACHPLGTAATNASWYCSSWNGGPDPGCPLCLTNSPCEVRSGLLLLCPEVCHVGRMGAARKRALL